MGDFYACNVQTLDRWAMENLVDALKQFHTFCNRSRHSRRECHSQDFFVVAKSNDADGVDDDDGIFFCE